MNQNNWVLNQKIEEFIIKKLLSKESNTRNNKKNAQIITKHS